MPIFGTIVTLSDLKAAVAPLATTAQVNAMSGTLEAQLQALTASLSADMATLATDLANIIAQLQPGATITAADIAALQAVKTAADNLVTTASAAP